MGPEPHLCTCRRCGKSEPKPDLPTSFDAALVYFEYVGERHRLCVERPDGLRFDGQSAVIVARPK